MPYLKKQQQIYFSMYHFIDRVLILWGGATLHFLCWNIATPTACITKPVYSKMVFFALVIINALYYWAAHEGNIQSRNESRLCQKKKRQNGGQSCQKSLHLPFPLQCGWFLQGGDGSFQVLWRRDLEVSLEWAQTYCVELERFSYDLEIKTCKQNKNNKQTEIDRFDWFIKWYKRAWLLVG